MNDTLNTQAQQYQAPADLLKDKIIMVTGAGDGIGRTAALNYAAHGATVLLLGRTQVKLEKVYDEIITAGGQRPSIAVINFKTAVADDYENLGMQIEQEFGHLDGLLHNAGLLGHRAPIEQFPVGSFMEVMHVNVNAQFVLTRTLLPLLKKSADASLLFTSSGVGRKGRAFWGAYAVSKFATEGLMEVLADELENTTVRTNCINPGATRTNMRAAAYPGEDPLSVKAPADIMAPYLFLMGEDSKAVNGESVNCQ
jgi:NAD(P)-dependent dehydrogenase (short-subunit alcohol dehydrogenase family)